MAKPTTEHRQASPLIRGICRGGEEGLSGIDTFLVTWPQTESGHIYMVSFRSVKSQKMRNARNKNAKRSKTRRKTRQQNKEATKKNNEQEITPY